MLWAIPPNPFTSCQTSCSESRMSGPVALRYDAADRAHLSWRMLANSAANWAHLSSQMLANSATDRAHLSSQILAVHVLLFSVDYMKARCAGSFEMSGTDCRFVCIAVSDHAAGYRMAGKPIDASVSKSDSCAAGATAMSEIHDTKTRLSNGLCTIVRLDRLLSIVECDVECQESSTRLRIELHCSLLTVGSLGRSVHLYTPNLNSQLCPNLDFCLCHDLKAHAPLSKTVLVSEEGISDFCACFRSLLEQAIFGCLNRIDNVKLSEKYPSLFQIEVESNIISTLNIDAARCRTSTRLVLLVLIIVPVSVHSHNKQYFCDALKASVIFGAGLKSAVIDTVAQHATRPFHPGRIALLSSQSLGCVACRMCSNRIIRCFCPHAKYQNIVSLARVVCGRFVLPLAWTVILRYPLIGFLACEVSTLLYWVVPLILRAAFLEHAPSRRSWRKYHFHSWLAG